MSLPSIRIEMERLPQGPWIYGRQVPSQDAPADGSLVEVMDGAGRFAGHGLYNGSSDIRIRMLSRGKRSALARPREFLLRKLSACNRLRRKVLRLPEVTTAWRMVHAEGDDLPGLIIDRLGDTLVCEYHALGFSRLREEIEWALGQLEPGVPVVHRVPKAASRAEGFEPPDSEPGQPTWIEEHGIKFPVHPGQGHKTGWFCDQRDNRQKIARLAKGRDVLDLCCNSGGFSLHCAKAGARRVRAADLDEHAIERGKAAAGAAALDVDFLHGDAFDVLRRVKEEARHPDLVILDPHKLIPGKARMEEGKRKYLDMNTLGIQAAAPGALLASFSCSGPLDLPGFLGLLFQAARRAERNVRLLDVMGASPDHPQRPEFSRSRYLKGALLSIDD